MAFMAPPALAEGMAQRNHEGTAPDTVEFLRIDGTDEAAPTTPEPPAPAPKARPAPAAAPPPPHILEALRTFDALLALKEEERETLDALAERVDELEAHVSAAEESLRGAILMRRQRQAPRDPPAP